MKVIFFGTTNLALPVLEALNNAHQVVAVVTTPDTKVGRKRELQESPVSALATDLKLPILKPEKVKGNTEFLKQLKDLGADIFVVVAYGKILPAECLDIPQFKTLNVHPSALPKYRGPSPIRTALLNGDEYTAVTFIVLDEQVDHGPIVAQQIVKIDPEDNDFILSDKLSHVAASMVNQVIVDYSTGKITPLPQDDSQASFTKMIEREDGKIDWQKTSTEIYNQFRAFYPWPGIWTIWQGKKIKIVDCFPAQNYELADIKSVGTVLGSGIVACGNGTAIKINRLQLEGKAETDVKSFLNGYSNFVGSKLG